MSKWKKRLLIVLTVIVVIIASLFLFLHDDADLDAIEKEQVESIDESVNGELGIDHISDDVKEFEDSLDTTN